MGFLGLCLLFVGIALTMNGVAAISKWDAKTTAFINIVTGTILVIGNFIGLFRADTSVVMHYNNAAAGFLFGITYIFIAANYLLKLDLRAFGWYSICVVIFAAISSIICIQNGAMPMGGVGGFVAGRLLGAISKHKTTGQNLPLFKHT